MKSGKPGPWWIYSEEVISDTEPIQFMPFPFFSLVLHDPYVWQNVYEETEAYSQPLETFVAQNPDIMEVIWFSTEL
jgi:hypothetical protein